MEPIEPTEPAEPTPAPDDAQAEADFAAGYGTDAPTGETPPVADAPLEPEPTATPAPTEPTPPPEPTKLDEAQIQRILAAAAEVDTLKSAVDKSFGKIGGIERTLKALQEQTPAGQPLTVSADDFEELKADFPELADMQVKGLNRALSKLNGTGGTPAVDPAQMAQLVEQHVSPKVQAIREESALQVCDLTMPGWRDDVNTPEFKAWFTAQQLVDTWDPVQIQKHLTTFKAQRAATPKPPAGNPRREILAAAVTPRGAGGIAPPDASLEDHFLAGFAGK